MTFDLFSLSFLLFIPLYYVDIARDQLRIKTNVDHCLHVIQKPQVCIGTSFSFLQQSINLFLYRKLLKKHKISNRLVMDKIMIKNANTTKPDVYCRFSAALPWDSKRNYLKGKWTIPLFVNYVKKCS